MFKKWSKSTSSSGWHKLTVRQRECQTVHHFVKIIAGVRQHGETVPFWSNLASTVFDAAFNI